MYMNIYKQILYFSFLLNSVFIFYTPSRTMLTRFACDTCLAFSLFFFFYLRPYRHQGPQVSSISEFSLLNWCKSLYTKIHLVCVYFIVILNFVPGSIQWHFWWMHACVPVFFLCLLRLLAGMIWLLLLLLCTVVVPWQ